jgi:hypothetical protein
MGFLLQQVATGQRIIQINFGIAIRSPSI